MKTDLELVEELLKDLEKIHPDNYDSKFRGLCGFIRYDNLGNNRHNKYEKKIKNLIFKYGPKEEDWKGTVYEDGSGYFYPVGDVGSRKKLLEEIIVELKKDII